MPCRIGCSKDGKIFKAGVNTAHLYERAMQSTPLHLRMRRNRLTQVPFRAQPLVPYVVPGTA